MSPDPTLTKIWAALIAFAVFAYVVMDGFDLGIGILFPWLRRGVERDTAMNSVAPVWDGNETWLVLSWPGLSRPPINTVLAAGERTAPLGAS